MENMKILRDRYERIAEEYQKDIRRIKNTFPYNQKVILEDENLYRRKKDSLNKEIAQVNIENKKIEKKIKSKLKNL